RRLERTVITAPMVFALLGLALGFFIPSHGDPHGRINLLLKVAEVGLVLVLFTDASRTDLKVLKSIRALPTRLLSTGMLLTIGLGMLAAKLILPGLSVWEAGALAAILAPTDAGLGQIIVNSPKVPMRIRQALNVEAGLNDGLAVPFLMCFMALSLQGTEGPLEVLVRFAIEQLGFGILVGLCVGLLGGKVLGWAHKQEWIAKSFQGIGIVTVPLLCVVVSEPLGASMFIAAFVSGLAVQIGFRDAGKHSVEFTEEWGQFLNLSVFFVFGVLVARAWGGMTAALFVYAALSLTVIRMLPVSIALLRTGLSPATHVFMGWFGPRGLASIVLGLIYFEHEVHTLGMATVRHAVMATVLLSIVAHGLTAIPGMNLYAKLLERLPDGAPEHVESA
ncbi:MAG TPA: cation:proton antiporter, partial [Kiritimatiellia bacterium]